MGKSGYATPLVSGCPEGGLESKWLHNPYCLANAPKQGGNQNGYVTLDVGGSQRQAGIKEATKPSLQEKKLGQVQFCFLLYVTYTFFCAGHI